MVKEVDPGQENIPPPSSSSLSSVQLEIEEDKTNVPTLPTGQIYENEGRGGEADDVVEEDEDEEEMRLALSLSLGEAIVINRECQSSHPPTRLAVTAALATQQVLQLLLCDLYSPPPSSTSSDGGMVLRALPLEELLFAPSAAVRRGYAELLYELYCRSLEVRIN